jgi:hypothetical protein
VLTLTMNIFGFVVVSTASVVFWSQFLAANPGVPVSVLDATRFSEQQWVWNGAHSAS